MYELKNWRRFLTLTAMCAVMVFGYVGVGHIAVATDGSHTGHVAMQQSGSGHQLVVFDKFGGDGEGKMVMTTDWPTTGQGMSVSASSTTGNFDGMFMAAINTDGHRIAPRPAGKTYFKDPMALMRETWQMDGSAMAASLQGRHRLSALRTQQGHQVMETGP